MAPVIHLDTHAVAWLYAGEVNRFPVEVRRRLETADLRISPMVVLELEYLFEIKRTTEPARAVLAELTRVMGLEVSREPFGTVVERSLGLNFTRDPFDRLIVAQAAVEEAPLLTKDDSILAAYPRAFWERG